MNRTFAIAILVLFTLPIFGQNENDKYKAGIKTAINLSTYGGTELENPRPRFGYSAGAYVRLPLKNKFHFQAEIIGNFKGSNFGNNRDSNEYSKISTFYIDMPLLLGYDLDNEGQMLLIGPQVGALGLSSVYVGNAAKATESDLGLSPLAVDGCLMYQKNGKVASFQTGLKIGLHNINRWIRFEDVNPPTGKGGIIRSVSFEIGFLF